ncbi:ERF family protein [Streptomyces sp. NPDC058758]|uniref:ERF family protein n=1 Tax=Streptomyces sp. NPDC058758 TaxID=3346627 RepID=UPI0036A87791
MAESTFDTPDLDELMSWSVDKAFIAAQREIAPIGKDGTNQDQKYNFRQAEDVIRACSGPMRKYGLRIFPAEIISREHQSRGKMNVTIIEVRWAVRGPSGDVMDTGIVTVGEAFDASDKASNKAMTAAEKYALLQAFKIEVRPGDLDDGDRDHPTSVSSPIDAYLARLRRPDVWYSREGLHEVLNVAANHGMLQARIPDEPEITLEKYVLRRGRELADEIAEREKARAEAHDAFVAQMALENPTPGPENDPWAVPPTLRQGGSDLGEEEHSENDLSEEEPFGDPDTEGTVEEPSLPDPALVQRLLDDARTDKQALAGIRDRFGAAALERIVVTSPWGQVNADSAITLALEDTAKTKPPTAPPAPPKRQTTQEKAKARMLIEARLQADMLGKEAHEHLAPVLPKGVTELERITSQVRLQKLIAEHRRAVLDAMNASGQTAAAELYSSAGMYVPARNIEAIVAAVVPSPATS